MLDYLIKFNATLLPHLLLITSTATKIFYEKKKKFKFLLLTNCINFVQFSGAGSSSGEKETNSAAIDKLMSFRN